MSYNTGSYNQLAYNTGEGARRIAATAKLQALASAKPAVIHGGSAAGELRIALSARPTLRVYSAAQSVGTLGAQAIPTRKAPAQAKASAYLLGEAQTTGSRFALCPQILMQVQARHTPTRCGYTGANAALQALLAAARTHRTLCAGTLCMRLASETTACRRAFSASLCVLRISAYPATLVTYGTETLRMPGLSLSPKDVLIIDTDMQTVTINGQNAMRYVALDDRFFNLLQGENLLLVEGADGAKLHAKIEWRDRYL